MTVDEVQSHVQCYFNYLIFDKPDSDGKKIKKTNRLGATTVKVYLM